MRVAVVHPYPVHRSAVGGTTRVNALVRYLAARHEVLVFAHATGDQELDAAAVDDLAALGVEQRLFPRPAASLRRRASWVFGSAPYFVGRNRNPELEGALRAASDEDGGVDLIHSEFAYLRPLLPTGPGRPALVLTEQEIMSLAIQRLRSLPRGGKSLYERYLERQGRAVAAFERAALSDYDRVFAITESEARAMADLAGRPVDVVPHVVCSETFSPGEEPEDPASVLFVGNYVHRPNLHALHWLLDSVWPLVRRSVPEARFRVVGPGLSASDRSAVASAPGVQILGRVDDLVREYRRASIFVNPVRSGGGMRGKVLEALACGRPLVSTSLGMDGVAARGGEHCDIADTPDDFARAVVRYLGSPERRRAHGRAGRELVRSNYDLRVVFERLERVYHEVVAERAERMAVEA